MSYQVLARKWRPQTFSEVIGQDHIVRSLANQIQTKSLGHAFLFSGTRGVGKTSMARILAKAVRCHSLSEGFNPCNTCSCCIDTLSDSSMDVIEIDGASNNSVDNIREIIESSKFLPVTGDKRIFIIDEVHMLSSSAFNALLKTLEEPPAHVVFIFATTEPEKLPATVLSRCQKYDFMEIPVSILVNQIKKIAKAEEITFENDEVIHKICLHGDGSVRDTLTLLEQALMFSKEKYIDSELIETSLGIIKEETISVILESLLLGDADSLKIGFDKIKSSRVQIDNFVLEFGRSIYNIILSNTNNSGRTFNVELNGTKIQTTIAELTWIFDIFSKEGSEALSGVFASMATEVLLLKLCLRKEILKNVGLKPKGTEEKEISRSGGTQGQLENNTKLEHPLEKPNNTSLLVEPELNSSKEDSTEGNKVEPLSQVETLPNEVSSVEVKEVDENNVSTNKNVETTEKNWEGFLETLAITSPATASNLEQGNVINGINYLPNEKINIVLGFSSESEVFYDYLSEKNSRDKILGELEKYFLVKNDQIEFELRLLEDVEKERIGFNSIVEIDEKNKEEERNVKTQQLLSNSLIVEAQDLFKSQIDKTIIQ